MKLSARNQFKGTVTKVQRGAVNGIVSLETTAGVITGTISLSAIDELGLEPGVKAVAIIKATEVMVGLGEMRLSARNQLKGTVASVKDGAVNGIVTLDVAGGNKVTSTISMNAIKDLELVPGKEATAVIKATSVMFGVE